MDQIVQLISQVGFPIVCVFGMRYYITKHDEKDQAERREWQKVILGLTDAINRLSVKIGD